MSKNKKSSHRRKQPDHIALYFAYGSNMNIKQMQFRCPDAQSLGHARLEGWKLAERMYCDIDQDDDNMVNGVLWAVTADCMESLDQYEGYPTVYIRGNVAVDFRGERYPAITYWMTARAASFREGQPFPVEYATGCIAGARQNDVPVDPILASTLSRKGRQRHWAQDDDYTSTHWYSDRYWRVTRVKA